MNLLEFINRINTKQPEIFVPENFISISENSETKIIPGNYKVWKIFISKTQPIVYLQLYVSVKVQIPENKELDIASEQICSCLITKPIITVKSKGIIDIVDIEFIPKDLVLDDKSSGLKLDEFFSIINFQLNLKAENKVIKYFIDKNTEKTKKSDELNEKLEYLKFHNIVDGKYLPKGSSSGKHENIIDISIKGFSNLPSVNDVLKRMESGTTQTTSGELLKKYIEIHTIRHIDALVQLNKSIEETLEMIDTKISYQSFLYKFHGIMPEGSDGNLVNEKNGITIKYNI